MTLAVQSASATAPSSATVPGDGSPSGGGSVLPVPTDGALPSDPLSVLYYFESKDQTGDTTTASSRINGFQTERHQALDKEKQAIQAAVDADKNRSFWDSLGDICGELAKVAGVVASVAVAVATAGAATPIAAIAIAGAVLSSASFVDGQFHVLQKLGVDAGTAGMIDMGASIGGAACSMGAAMVAGGTAASTAASTIGKGAAVVSGLGMVGKGAATIGSGEATAEKDDAEADQVAARARTDSTTRAIAATIAAAESDDEQDGQAKRTIASTKVIQDETPLTALGVATRG